MIAGMQTTSSRLCPEWITLERSPADATLPLVEWESAKYIALQVNVADFLPGGLKKGDIVDARLSHEFDCESDGDGFWTTGGVRSEHWSMWPMASTAVQISATPAPNVGAYVIEPQETNWSQFTHHLGISRSDLYRVPADMPTAYVYDRIYFKGGKAYTPLDPLKRRVQVNPAPYSRLTVAVHRG